MSFILEKYKNVIFSGDINVHHPWWGCDYEDNAGKIFSRLIDAHNLIVLNDRLPTVFLHPNARRSVIDLVLVSASLAPQCHSFIDHNAAKSDHFPVFISIRDSFSF